MNILDHNDCDFKQLSLLNPKAGDVWLDRVTVIYLVIGTIEEFIVLSKSYRENHDRVISNNPNKFKILTKEEFQKETRHLYPLLLNNEWVTFVQEMNLPNNLLDNPDILKLIEDKKQTIKLNGIPEVQSLRDPQPGDVWNLNDNNSIIILDKYLKDYLIISYCESINIPEIFYKIRVITDIRIIPYEEFKFCVLNNQTIEQGFSAKVSPYLLEDAVEDFKQST